MKHVTGYSPELRERAVRMVREQEAEYASHRDAVAAIAETVGCTTETLRSWIRQAQRNAERADLTASERRRLKELERENRELMRTNELLRKTTALFAQAALERGTIKW